MITVCQRVNDAGWVRPEMTTLSKGVFADGLGTIFAGLVGSVGVNPGASCIGLVSATGVASRVIAYAVGGMLIALAFLPPLTGILVLMPRPVIGAALFFAACFILINGLQTMTSRMIDARRTLVLGLAMSMGIAAEAVPNFIPNAPAMLQPIMGSSLVLGTITALLLNGLFRLGQRKRVTLTVDSAATNVSAKIDDFFNESGKRWGARRDVMDRVSFGVNQAVEAVREHCEPQGPVLVEAQFDEFNLNVQIIYQGAPLRTSRPPAVSQRDYRDRRRAPAGWQALCCAEMPTACVRDRKTGERPCTSISTIKSPSLTAWPFCSRAPSRSCA